MRNCTGKEDVFTFPTSEVPCFRLDLMGTSYCDGSYYIERHQVRTWVFEHVIKGRGTVVVDGETFHPSAGDTYIIPAFTDHRYYSNRRDPWEKQWFNVNGHLVQSLMTAYGISGGIVVQIPELKAVFDRRYKQCLTNPLEAHHIASMAVHEIISIIAHHQSEKKIKRTQVLHDYLATHVNTSISTDDMAAIQSLSVSQTIRLFKTEWGTTPYQYHLDCRLAAADELLKSTTGSIRMISENLGFEDEYHFAALFKRKRGIAPGKYRQRALQSNQLSTGNQH